MIANKVFSSLTIIYFRISRESRWTTSVFPAGMSPSVTAGSLRTCRRLLKTTSAKSKDFLKSRYGGSESDRLETPWFKINPEPPKNIESLLRRILKRKRLICFDQYSAKIERYVKLKKIDLTWYQYFIWKWNSNFY